MDDAMEMIAEGMAQMWPVS